VIAKRIMTPQGGSGYQRLAGYVLNVGAEHQGAGPASWTRLNGYLLDTAHAGEKVAWARVRNCQSDDPGWAVAEILATQGHNRRSRADKSYHLVVSFPEGERPTRAQMEDIEDTLCAAIGFEAHQRVSAVHQNTDNWHLHIAINKVDPQSFRNVTPHRDHFRLQAACAELEIRHGLTREPHTLAPGERGRMGPGRAAQFEAHQGTPSFLAWVREHAGPALLAARESGLGWTELHRVAASFDLVLKPRGAGLVIGHAGNGRLHIKASDVDRGLSLPALSARLGPYMLAEQQQPTGPRTRYEPRPRGGALYEAFQRERSTALAEREAALAALRARQVEYARQLATYYRDRLRRERLLGLRGPLRQDALRHIVAGRARDQAERVRRDAADRRALRDAHPIPSWQGYLEAEAARGNVAALQALRSRIQRQAQAVAQLLAAEGATEVRHVVHAHLRPAVRRDGRMIYRIADGGLVSDESRTVRVNQVSAGAVILALSLASERFGNRKLVVQGSDAFRQEVAEAAGRKQLGVSFADTTLERQRIHHAIAQRRTVDRGRADGAGFT
jgi:hypothetical protein